MALYVFERITWLRSGIHLRLLLLPKKYYYFYCSGNGSSSTHSRFVSFFVCSMRNAQCGEIVNLWCVKGHRLFKITKKKKIVSNGNGTILCSYRWYRGCAILLLCTINCTFRILRFVFRGADGAALIIIIIILTKRKYFPCCWWKEQRVCAVSRTCDLRWRTLALHIIRFVESVWMNFPFSFCTPRVFISLHSILVLLYDL